MPPVKRKKKPRVVPEKEDMTEETEVIDLTLPPPNQLEILEPNSPIYVAESEREKVSEHNEPSPPKKRRIQVQKRKTSTSSESDTVPLSEVSEPNSPSVLESFSQEGQRA